MTEHSKERRKFKRYNMDAEIHFDFIYDLETKVKFEIIDQEDNKVTSDKYLAISRNISVGGLCFVSSKKLKQAELLHLEVYLPGAKDPIHMIGRVEWCKPVPPSYEDRILEEMESKRVYEVGVRSLSVNEVSVDESIHHDAVYDVDWSIVLESVFGSYKTLMEGIFKSQSE